MKLQMFSVFDQPAGAYLPPFYARTRGEALRQFMDALCNPEHQFAKHPKDYTLFFLAEFDDNTGAIQCEATPSKMASAYELLSGME